MTNPFDDTGPPYPPPPVAGSNAIGEFAIGISPVGTISPWDVWETVQSQYANSPIITKLLTNFAEFIDPTSNLENFFDLVMNVDTAQGYGLDVWGRIVGVGRYLRLHTPGRYFGFDEGYPDYDGFNQSPFYDGSVLTEVYRLEDIPYRRLILAKALSNICDGSIPAINQLLINLFDTPRQANCYVTEGTPFDLWFGFAEGINYAGFNQAPFYDGSPSYELMTMTYTFHRKLSPVEEAIIYQSNVLPKPTGVRATVVQIY